MNQRNINWLALITAILIPLIIGGMAALFTVPNIQGWYQGLNKPSFNPPKWIFAPVWNTLYVLMGVASYLIWRDRKEKNTTPALSLYFIQLALNFFWSLIFFEFHAPGYAFIEVLLLWLFIVATILHFSRINKAAAWLLMPYISWVSFATVLNYEIWRLN